MDAIGTAIGILALVVAVLLLAVMTGRAIDYEHDRADDARACLTDWQCEQWTP